MLGAGHRVPDLHYYSGQQPLSHMPHIHDQGVEMQQIPVQGIMPPLVPTQPVRTAAVRMQHQGHISTVYPQQGATSHLSVFHAQNAMHANVPGDHIIGMPNACMGCGADDHLLPQALQQLPSPQVNEQPVGHGQAELALHSMDGLVEDLHLSQGSHHPGHPVLEHEIPQICVQQAGQACLPLAAQTATFNIPTLLPGMGQQERGLSGQGPDSPQQVLMKTKDPMQSPQESSAKRSPAAKEGGLLCASPRSPMKESPLTQTSEILLASRGNSADVSGAIRLPSHDDWSVGGHFVL